MVLRRRPGSKRRIGRVLVLGGAISGITALRNIMLARNEKRFADVVAEPGSDPPG